MYVVTSFLDDNERIWYVTKIKENADEFADGLKLIGIQEIYVKRVANDIFPRVPSEIQVEGFITENGEINEWEHIDNPENEPEDSVFSPATNWFRPGSTYFDCVVHFPDDIQAPSRAIEYMKKRIVENWKEWKNNEK